MKRLQSIILMQGAVTIAALAFAIGVTKSPPDDPLLVLDQLQDTTKMTQLLNLDPPQAQQLAILNTTLMNKLKGSCHRNCSARQELVRSDPADKNTHEAILQKMCKAYEDSERATLDHVQSVRAILDEKQRAKMDQLLGRCRCGGCENGCK